MSKPIEYNTTDEEIVHGGFMAGINWPAHKWQHEPGGPHVSNPDAYRNDPHWVEFCGKQERHNKMWKAAWLRGLATQATTNTNASQLLKNIVTTKNLVDMVV